jgi:hypothetical protein
MGPWGHVRVTVYRSWGHRVRGMGLRGAHMVMAYACGASVGVRIKKSEGLAPGEAAYGGTGTGVPVRGYRYGGTGTGVPVRGALLRVRGYRYTGLRAGAYIRYACGAYVGVRGIGDSRRRIIWPWGTGVPVRGAYAYGVYRYYTGLRGHAHMVMAYACGASVGTRIEKVRDWRGGRFQRCFSTVT